MRRPIHVAPTHQIMILTGARISLLILLLSIVPLFISSSARAEQTAQDGIDFWQKNFTELSPQEDARAAKAHEIFESLVKVAGSRAGVVPRLFIVKEGNHAMALRDNWIIISREVIDECYRVPELGDARLAFLLGHEIAHLLKEDFPNIRFFEAAAEVTETQAKETAAGKLQEEIREREREADEYGIVYAAMAGFDTRAIVTEENVNFFTEYVKRTDTNHPAPEQRAEVVLGRLRQVVDNVDYFNIGVFFYETGQYHRAILAFRKFLASFPCREVYYDLAASHHQAALEYYRRWKNDEDDVPFKLSLSVEPVTRAASIRLRGGADNPEIRFREHIDKAIELYETAISHDPSYIASYGNLGCALIYKGDAYEAVAELRRALKIEPNAKEILNNLGVAYYFVENQAKARESLLEAHRLDPAYDAPLFNLGRLDQKEGKQDECRVQWLAYLELDPVGPWADAVRATLSLESPEQSAPSLAIPVAEKILSVRAGAKENEIPEQWGQPQSRQIPLEENPYRLNIYPNKVMTVSEEDKLILIVTLDGFAGTSNKGIAIGGSLNDVLTAYGRPDKILDTTQGVVWLYESLGVAFRFQGDRLTSWILFET